MPALFKTIALLAALSVGASATALAADGEDNRGLWQINVEAAQSPQQVNARRRGDNATQLGSEPSAAKNRPGSAHVAISLGDGSTI